MVKLKGPGLALGASGSVADAVTFAKWKGRHYLRTKTTPADPKSNVQISCRAMMSFLAEAWSTLTTTNQATFSAPAAELQISPFNFYVQYNLDRWRTQKPPVLSYPALEDDLPGVVDYELFAATGGPGHVTLYAVLDTYNQTWGLTIHRNLAPAITADRTNVKHVALAPEIVFGPFKDEFLSPGRYYYNIRYFSEAGVYAGAVVERYADVT